MSEDGGDESDQARAKSFEDHLSAVEAAIRRLEVGDIPLEDSIELYASAMRDLGACHGVLEKAERRLEIVRREVGGDSAAGPARLDESEGVVEA